jgi:hypothetical protein
MEEEGHELLQVRDRSTCAGPAQETGIDEVEHNSFVGVGVNDELMLSWSAWIRFQRQLTVAIIWKNLMFSSPRAQP